MSVYLKRAIFILLVMTFILSYLITLLYNRDFREVFESKDTKTIVIDAGHGIPDGGATADDDTAEEKINLEISKKLCDYLTSCGYKIIMTRTTNEGIYDSGETIKQKKLSDMKNREKIMNESLADIFISIHMNKFSDPSVFGAQVFYSPFESSDLLAEYIQDELLKIDVNNHRVSKAAGESIYLMKKANVPAVIVECGFLSNDREKELLKTEEYQIEISKAITKGIKRYFSSIDEKRETF